MHSFSVLCLEDDVSRRQPCVMASQIIHQTTQYNTTQHNTTPHHTTHTISQLALLFYSQLFGSFVCCSFHLHCNLCVFLSLLHLFSLSKHFTSMIIFIKERARDPIKLILKFIYSWVNFVTTVSTKSMISKCKINRIIVLPFFILFMPDSNFTPSLFRNYSAEHFCHER